MTLAAITEGVWLDAEPVSIVGMKLSATMTVLRLPKGDLVLHSPVALTDERREAVDRLGTLRHLIAPNPFHHR